MRLRLLIVLCLAVGAAAGAAASPATAQPNPPPCQNYAPVDRTCTQVSGPWVTAPGEGTNEYPLYCPNNMQAVDAAAEFPYGNLPLGIEVGGGVRPGVAQGFLFAAIATQNFNVTFQPWLACMSHGPVNVSFRARRDRIAGAFRIHVRTKRLRPERHVRIRLGCRRGQQLVHSGSAVAFFTRRPPTQHVVRAVARRHRHVRTRSGTRTDATTPAGVGDNERVELTVTTVCRP